MRRRVVTPISTTRMDREKIPRIISRIDGAFRAFAFRRTFDADRTHRSIRRRVARAISDIQSSDFYAYRWMVDYCTRRRPTTRGDETKYIIITLVMTAVFLVTLVVLEATTVEKASLEESAEASIVLSLLECCAVWRSGARTNASFRVSHEGCGVWPFSGKNLCMSKLYGWLVGNFWKRHFPSSWIFNDTDGCATRSRSRSPGLLATNPDARAGRKEGRREWRRRWRRDENPRHRRRRGGRVDGECL